MLGVATLWYAVTSVWIRGHFVIPLTSWLKCWLDSACKGFNSGPVCPQLWWSQHHTLLLCIGPALITHCHDSSALHL
jgi:hypothetical protein